MTTPAGLLLAPLLLLMAGCTTVRIYNASVTEEKYPGLLVLKIAPLQGATLTVTQGLGLTLAQRSATLVWIRRQRASASDGNVDIQRSAASPDEAGSACSNNPLRVPDVRALSYVWENMEETR